MSAAIKRMLAERAALAARQAFAISVENRQIALAMDRIAAAASILNDDVPTSTWLPSELATIGYCVIATGKGGIKGADAFLDEFLNDV